MDEIDKGEGQVLVPTETEHKVHSSLTDLLDDKKKDRKTVPFVKIISLRYRCSNTSVA